MSAHRIGNRSRFQCFASRALACAALLLCCTLAQGADIAGAVNEIRKQGCGGHPGVKSTVQASGQLAEVAQQLARGGRLSGAIERLGYRAARSTSIHVQGTSDTAAIARLLREQYCDAINNDAYREVGVFARGNQTWIVLATPYAAPDPGNASAVARRVLELVNTARSQARRCGRKAYDATHPLKLSATLNEAAAIHARDMASSASLEHRGSDGSQPAQRATRVGYQWRAVAENIAAAQSDADEVVASWLQSPGHCANIMGAQFTEMGVAFALAPQSAAGIYWAQVFAAPK